MQNEIKFKVLKLLIKQENETSILTLCEDGGVYEISKSKSFEKNKGGLKEAIGIVLNNHIINYMIVPIGSRYIYTDSQILLYDDLEVFTAE